MDGEPPFSMLDVIGLLNLPYPPAGRASYNINCPCCDTHNKRHLNINLAKGVFRCPRCGFAGGVLDLYGYYANMDRAQAYKAIAEKMGVYPAAAKRLPRHAAPPEAVECPLAGIEERDAAYRAFLNRLSLASDHRANLLPRGLTDEAIQQNLYRTTPAGGYAAIAKQLLADGHYLSGVPGFYRKEGVWTYFGTKRGILLPVRDYYGRIQGVKVRLDNEAPKPLISGLWRRERDSPGGFAAASPGN